MVDIKKREEKIWNRQQQYSFREFLFHVASRRPLTFYKNNDVFGHFPPHTKIHIVDSKIYDSDRDSLTEYWFSYDFEKSFFAQQEHLLYLIPFPNILLIWACENSIFSSFSVNCKNTYLSTTINGWENICYSIVCRSNVTNIYNSVFVLDNCDNIYACTFVINSQNIFFSFDIENCFDCRLSTNLISCQYCIKCDWLQNQSYCIDNIQYWKEEFFVLKKQFLADNIMWMYKLYASIIKFSFDSTSKLSDSLDHTLFIYNSYNCKNTVLIWWHVENKNLNNVIYSSFNNTDCVWWHWYHETSHAYIWEMIIRGQNNYYSQYLEDCSYCLWCVWLKNKSFCILNKQYTKEERFEFANKIFEQMDKDWSLWEFFPWSMNPFYFNDTAAYLIDDSFTKEEVTKEWYLWRDGDIKVDIPENSQIVQSRRSNVEGPGWLDRLDDIKTLDQFQWFDENWNWKIDQEILNKVIRDWKWNYYRIVKMEYDFLMKHGLPLPELHWLDRIKLGFKFK